MRERSRSPARLLAPLALIAFVVAFAYVVVSSEPAKDEGGGDSRAEQASDLGTTETATETSSRRRSGRLPEGCYVVRTGDSLAGIAAKTGVQVEALQELNPDADPQQLAPGQRLNLREAGCD